MRLEDFRNLANLADLPNLADLANLGDRADHADTYRNALHNRLNCCGNLERRGVVQLPDAEWFPSIVL